MEEIVLLGIRCPSGKQVEASLWVTAAFSKLSCMCAQWSSSNHNKQCFACTCLAFFLFLLGCMLSSSAFHKLFPNSSESRTLISTFGLLLCKLTPIYNNHDHAVNMWRPNTTAPGSNLSPCIKTLHQNCSAEPRSLKRRSSVYVCMCVCVFGLF